MSENITQAVDQMATAFESFKKANDERLDRLERYKSISCSSKKLPRRND